MSGFNFNAPTTNKGFTFGSPAASTATGFGGFAAPAAQPNQSGFNFGSPAPLAAAAAAAPTTGFNFNNPQNVNAPPTGNAPPSFGTAAVPAFGTNNPPPSFGSIPTAAVPAFGSTAGTAPPPFGTVPPTSAPAFGTNINSVTSSFGSTGFGTPATSTGLNFGTPATAAPAFGASPNTNSGFNFGGTGNVASTAAPNQSNFNFNSAPNFSQNLASNFSTKPPATNLFQAPTGINTIGTKPLFETTPIAAVSNQPTGLTLTPNVTAKPSVGLGGVDLNATQPKSLEGKQDNIKIKDIIIPDQISETVENLKNFIKHQKSTSSDIARATIRKLSNVSEEIQQLEWALREIANCCEKNYTQIKLLRTETSKAIQSTEMAQRTHETPIGLQFENIMPLQYFQELVKKYESDIIAFRNQVELTEKHMLSLANPQSFTPEDLKRGLKQIHESFISLAGRVHEIHQKVEAQKEHYLNLRKYYLRDTQNVFVELEKENTDSSGISNITAGPTPFSLMSNITWQASKANLHHNPTTVAGSFNNMAAKTNNSIQNQSMLGNNPSLFATGNASVLPAFGTPFNLQTPPIGAKRNKQ